MTRELERQLSEADSEEEIIEILKNNMAEFTEDDMEEIVGGINYLKRGTINDYYDHLKQLREHIDFKARGDIDFLLGRLEEIRKNK